MTGPGWEAAGGPRGHPVGAETDEGERRMNDARAARRGLDGRIAVVTGGAGGIGRAVVERLDREGATVRVLDIAAGRGSWTTQQAIEARGVDVRDQHAVRAAFRETGWQPDILVNVAGVFEWEPAADVAAAAWTSTIEVNLTGTAVCCA